MQQTNCKSNQPKNANIAISYPVITIPYTLPIYALQKNFNLAVS